MANHKTSTADAPNDQSHTNGAGGQMPSDIPMAPEVQTKALVELALHSAVRGVGIAGVHNGEHQLRLMQEAFYRYCLFVERFGKTPFVLENIGQWEQMHESSADAPSKTNALFAPAPDTVDALISHWRERDVDIDDDYGSGATPGTRALSRSADSNPYRAFLRDEGYGHDRKAIDGTDAAGRYLIGNMAQRSFIDAIPAKEAAETLNRYQVSGVHGGAGSRAESDAAKRLFLTREVKDADTASTVYNFQKELKVVHRESIAEVAALAQRFPNMRPVVDWLIDTLSLNLMTPYPYVNWPPILLNGPPGVGKTAFVRALGEILDLHAEFMDCSLLQAPFELFGAHPTWGGATEGRITGAMARSEDANLIFMLDEFDKTSGSGNQQVQPAFATVLEPTTAASVKDGFLDMAFDMRHVNWICTSNETQAINRFLLSRLKVFDIKAPKRDQMPAVIRSVWKDLRDANRHTWGHRFAEPLHDRFVETFIRVEASPRAIRKTLQHTCARQAREMVHIHELANEAIALDPNLLLIDDNEDLAKKRSVGFVS